MSTVSGDAADRLAYLAETVDVLWPGAAGRRRVVVPAARTPRLLVPVRPGRAAASALMRYTAQQGARDRMIGFVLAAGARAGLCSLLPPVRSSAAPGESIDDHIAAALGHPVSTALALTSSRANRKPVLQVFDRRGRTLAFAKIGTDALTRSLVDAEAASLRRLAAGQLRCVDVPAVLHHGTWGDTRVLVMSALGAGFGAGRVGARHAALLDDAMYDVSRAHDGHGQAVGWRAAVRTLASQSQAGTGDHRLVGWLALLDEAAEALALDDLELGTWHGDWTEWNCSARGRRVAVWDWERSAAGAPVGFDKLHFELNRAVGPARDRYRGAATELVDNAPSLLRRWQLTPEQARATAVAYLLQLALRYLRDAAPTRSVGSQVEDWAYPAVRAALVSRAGARI